MLPRRVVTALYFFTAALLLQHAVRLSWGGANASDGTRYKVGAAIMVHVLAPHQTVSPTVTCSVDIRNTDPPPCELAPGGEQAARRIHAAWHTLPAMVAFPIFAALLALAPPRIGRWSRVPAVGGIGAILFVVILMATQPPLALQALSGLDYGIGGNLGMMEVALALLLLSAPLTTVTAPWDLRRGGRELLLLAILAGLTLLSFRLLDWTPVVVLLAPTTALAYGALTLRLRPTPGVDRASERR